MKHQISKRPRYASRAAAHLVMGGLVALAVIISPLGLVQPVKAAAELTVTPITWNVVGLDSNNVNVGPNNFPVGARVCNAPGADPATDVSASFVWDSSDSYIDLRTGSLATIELGTLAAGECRDAYFEVSINRDSAAYDHTRRYHIAVTAGGGIALSTPTPRGIYVERLVSQSRNATMTLTVEPADASGETPVPEGGTYSAVRVGETYTITLTGATATNGYEQIETFINFSNTIFRINSVTTTYTADAGTDDDAESKLYADGCSWENDPDSPNYRACTSTGKYGGAITVTYNVTIIGGGGTSETLNALVYDFSGSSYHYSSDYGDSERTFIVVDETELGFSKSFSPDPISAGGTSRLTFTITNPNAIAVDQVGFSDSLPLTMTVASPASSFDSGCGSPTFAPVAGAGSISATGISLAPNATCTLGVNVTASVVGDYLNTTTSLIVAGVDTGKVATDTLTVTDEPTPPTPPSSCVNPVDLASWSFSNYTASTATQNGPFSASYQITGTSGALATPRLGSLSTSGIASPTVYPSGWVGPDAAGNVGNSWGIRGGWLGAPGTVVSSTFEFQVPNVTRYGGYGIVASYNMQDNWSNSGYWHILYSTDGGSSWSQLRTAAFDKSAGWKVGAITGTTTSTGLSTVAFRIYADSAQKDSTVMYLDTIRVTGCGTPMLPRLTKQFSPNPIAVGGTSVLIFTLTNTDLNALPGATFVDTLPAGLQVANTPGAVTTCGGTWAPSAGATTVSFAGGTIPANGSCTVRVNVTATTGGPHPNVSGFISTTLTGVNDTATGFGSDTLFARLQPTIDKVFSPNPILDGGTVTLTFTLHNPNDDISLMGVAFTDTLPTTPGALRVADPALPSSTCGGTWAPAPNATTLSFTGGTILPNDTCTLRVRVTVPAAAGAYVNTTSAVTADLVGGTDTATDTLVVRVSQPGLGFNKQIATTSTGPWLDFVAVTLPADVFYRVMVENTGDMALTGVSVSDPALGTPLACSWPDPLPVADITDEGHIATCMVGPVTAVSGIITNTATADSSETAPITDTASYATTGLTLNKVALDSAYTNADDTLRYNYVITNTGFAPLRGPVVVTDDKITVDGRTVTCPAVLTVVPDGDNFLDPGEAITCTATYTVLEADTGVGMWVTNTATAAVDSVVSNLDIEDVPWYESTAVTFTAVRTAGPLGFALGAGMVLALGGVVLAEVRRRRRTG